MSRGKNVLSRAGAWTQDRGGRFSSSGARQVIKRVRTDATATNLMRRRTTRLPFQAACLGHSAESELEGTSGLTLYLPIAP